MSLSLLNWGLLGEQGRLARWRALSRQILANASELETLSDSEMLTRARELSWRARSGEPLAQLMPSLYALGIAASSRSRGWRHYPVQIMGGIGLFEGGVAEMQTGEGKTLTAVLPVALHALMGKGCHVVTVNDYLAERDAELMGPIYRLLGLSVGRILSSDQPQERIRAYRCDITYGTAKEFGFDYLRDKLQSNGEEFDHSPHRLLESDSQGTVQRERHFALIDEVDSILVDEARTPLIIALTLPNDAATVNLYRWADRVTEKLTIGEDFFYESDTRKASLTQAGCRKVLLISKPALLDTIDSERIYKQVEQALVAQFGFIKDRDYVVVDRKEVSIVDESTGRIMEGRRWQEGLHQAIEAKERLPITPATGQAARITIQSYFREYQHLAGMTGTARSLRKEFWKTFRLKVTSIPTHRTGRRIGLPTRVFSTRAAKLAAVVESVRALTSAGRAVLIGTPSVHQSEHLSELLQNSGIEHQTLNARQHAKEAKIVAEAGQPGRVTIATNMAGRGTDIHLAESVWASGGLHVIATEMHSSVRIDRQLVGRCGRQGDPGSYQFFLSLEDELLRVLKPSERESVKKRATGNELSRSWIGFFRKTQKFLERLHARQRKQVLKQEKQRIETFQKMGLDPNLEMTES